MQTENTWEQKRQTYYLGPILHRYTVLFLIIFCFTPCKNADMRLHLKSPSWGMISGLTIDWIETKVVVSYFNKWLLSIIITTVETLSIRDVSPWNVSLKHWKFRKTMKPWRLDIRRPISICPFPKWSSVKYIVTILPDEGMYVP